MSPRIRLPIHHRRINRSGSSQLLPRHHSTRYILCGSPFPLRPFYRSSICHHSRNYPLIPSNLQNLNKPQMTYYPIRHHIYWSKLNILPPTFLRTKWNTSAILRLPRCILILKHCLILRFHNFIRIYHNAHIHLLRSPIGKTTTRRYPQSNNQKRMEKQLPTRKSHLQSSLNPNN